MMILSKIGNVYVAHGDVSGYERELKQNGFYFWSPTYARQKKWYPKKLPFNTCWFTYNKFFAVKFVKYADLTCKKELEDYGQTLMANVARSYATDSDFHPPIPDGFQYYPFQRAGIEYALKCKNLMIADPMGLGKTIQAIGVINADESLKKILIVVPPSLRLNWIKELNKFLTRNLSIQLIDHKTQQIDGDILVVAYDSLWRFKTPILTKMNFDIIIADEVHNVKNNKAKRSKAFYEIAKNVNRRLYLTGTPILNRPVELYYILKSLGLKMSYYTYVYRYCDARQGFYGLDVSGASNIEELNILLRGHFIIRRKKEDVLHDLPPKHRQIIFLPPKRYRRLIQREYEALGMTQEGISELIENKKLDEIQKIIKKPITPGGNSFDSLFAIRRELAELKIPDVIAYLKENVDEKAVVFTHHYVLAEAIYNEFKNEAVLYTGKMNEDDRNTAVERFQHDENIKFFVGTIHSAGVGLTLTAASTLIFAEIDWTPSMMSQAEDRIHRIGQKSPVLIQYLIVDGSLDSYLLDMIIEKQKVISHVLDDEKN